jgi:hypothetical protein
MEAIMTNPRYTFNKIIESQKPKESKEQLEKENRMRMIRQPVLVAKDIDPLEDYYRYASRCRKGRFHGPYAYGTEKRIKYIVEEIKYRVKICKKEMFEIGGLLTEAKQIVGHGKFKQFIEDNFDFSYETANNFMNVYKTCLASPQIVTSLKASVLYQIAAPGFPADLRQYIFEHVDDVYTWKDTPVKLEEITNQDIKELLKKYKAGEIDNESEEIKKIFEENKKISQFGFVIDQLELCLRSLEKYKDNISTAKGEFTLTGGYLGSEYKGQDPIVGRKIHEVCEAIESFIEKLTFLMGDLEKVAK